MEDLRSPRPTGSAADAGIELLANVPGLDVAQGLARVRGDQRRYLLILRSGVAGQAKDVADVASHLQAGAWDEARQLAHRLKGGAATLGATAMATAAADLEKVTRLAGESASSPPQGQLELAALQQAHGELAAVLAALPPGQAQSADAAPQWGELLPRLAVLLAASDAGAVALVQQHSVALQSTFGADGEQLLQDVQRFSFDSAAQLVATMQAPAAAGDGS